MDIAPCSALTYTQQGVAPLHLRHVWYSPGEIQALAKHLVKSGANLKPELLG